MSSSLFRVTEYICSGQHIREYPRATKRRQEDVLRIAVKQYTPLNAVESDSDVAESDLNAVTIIAAPANGFPKECYEPLWDEILERSQGNGFRIRSIWVAQMSHQGDSGVLNEDLQGDDPSWLDHSRDLLLIINQFRDQMPRPLIGIGHSVGACQLLHLSIIHPRLLAAVIFVEPMIQRALPPGPNAALPSTFRRDIWPTLAAASASLRKKEFFASWDPRAFDRLIAHGLRRTPTPVRSLSHDEFTLTTTKHQEAWTFVRPNFAPQLPPATDPASRPARTARLLAPDLDPAAEGAFLFHRAEAGLAEAELPFLRPTVLYLFAGGSVLSPPHAQAHKVAATGAGVGGSGGVAAGLVASVVFPAAGHLLPFEDVAGCATAVGGWLGKEVMRWKEDEAEISGWENGKSDRDMLVVSETWRRMVRLPAGAQRPRREKL